MSREKTKRNTAPKGGRETAGDVRGEGRGRRRKRREDTTVNMEDRMKETRQDVLEAHFTQSSSE